MFTRETVPRGRNSGDGCSEHVEKRETRKHSSIAIKVSYILYQTNLCGKSL